MNNTYPSGLGWEWLEVLLWLLALSFFSYSAWLLSAMRGKRESKRGSAGPTGTSRGSLNTAMSLSKWKSNGNGGVLSESESLIPRGKQPW